MNFTKKILGSAAAFGMAALCLCNAGLSLMADDGLALGDVNYDGYVNASDAAKVLIAAASLGAGEGSGLTDDQIYCADVNFDGIVNASDAAQILIYAAYIGAGGTATLFEYLHPGEEPIDPTEPGTEPPDEPQKPTELTSNGVWSIGYASASPGDIVRIPVLISETTMGVNSYLLNVQLEAPLELVSVENGNAFREFEVIANLKDGRIAATNYHNDKNIIAEQKSTVCYLNVKVPENVAPGTRFTVSLDHLRICDYNMTTYTANTSDGSIEVQ
ncbi:MAG: hypothetical protein K5695_07535 [Oscillospiraceae bacterium]|nr:hypothetical protein [Oscillospiraceae bacterium]